MKKIIFFFLMLIFLQFTDGYKLLLLLNNSKTRVASILTLLILLSYIFLNLKAFSRLHKNKLFKHWLRIIVYLPILFHLLHLFLHNVEWPDFINWVSLNMLAGSLFTVSCMLSLESVNINRINMFFFSAFIFTIIGLLISIINYPFIIRLEILTGDTRYDPDNFSGKILRAVGFYGQPNLAAKSLFSCFIILLGGYFFSKKIYIKLLFSLFVIISLIWTGSRTTILIFFITFIIYYPFNFNNSFIGKKGFILNKIFTSFKLFMPIVILVLVLPIVFSYFDGETATFLKNRFSFLDDSNVNNNNLDTDISVQQRLNTISDYIGFIVEKPILGYGASKRKEFIENGTFRVGAQNEYLESAFSFGIFYVGYYLFVLLKTFRMAGYYFVKNKNILAKSLQVFTLVIFLYGFSLNYLNIDRVNIILLGFLVGGSFNKTIYNNDCL